MKEPYAMWSGTQAHDRLATAQNYGGRETLALRQFDEEREKRAAMHEDVQTAPGRQTTLERQAIRE